MFGLLWYIFCWSLLTRRWSFRQDLCLPALGMGVQMSRYGLIRGYLLVHDGKHRRKLYFNVRDRSSVEACLAPGLPLVLDKSMDDVELISASPSGLDVRIAGKTYTWSCTVPDEFGKWVLAIIRSKSLKDCGWNYFGDSKDVVYAIEDNNKVRQTNGGCTEVSTWLDGDCLVRTTMGESTTETWLNTGNVKTTFRDGKVVKSSTQNKKTTTIFPDGRVEERDRGVLIEKLGRMERRTQPDGSYTEFEDQTHRHYDKYKRLEYTVFFWCREQPDQVRPLWQRCVQRVGRRHGARPRRCLRPRHGKERGRGTSRKAARRLSRTRCRAHRSPSAKAQNVPREKRQRACCTQRATPQAQGPTSVENQMCGKCKLRTFLLCCLLCFTECV